MFGVQGLHSTSFTRQPGFPSLAAIMFFLIYNRKSVAPVSVVMIDEFIIVFSKGLHVSL